MGYELHLTRQDNWWTKDAAKQISETEWRAVIEADCEMRLCGGAELPIPSGGTLRYENPLLAEWIGHLEHEIVWFDFLGGNVVVKNPDESTVIKMQQLARELRARLQGDEGEFYE